MNKRLSYYALNFMVAFLAVYGIVMYLPILELLQKHFDVSVKQISWLPNIVYLNMIIFSPIVGALTKKFKINKILIGAIGLWIIGIVVGIVALKSKSFNLFIIGRFIEGIGEASFFPLILTMNSMVMKSDEHSKTGASMVEIGSAVGGLIAGVLAGVMSGTLEIFLIVPIVIGVMTMILTVVTTKGIETSEASIQVSNEKENKSVYISLLLLMGLSQAVFVSAQVYLSYYLKIFNMEHQTGLIIAVQQITIGIGAMLPVIILRKLSLKQVRNIVLSVITISVIALYMNISYEIAVIAVVTIATAIGVAFTSLNIAVAKTIKSNYGTKMSLYNSMRFLGGFIFSYTFGSVIGKATIKGTEYSEVFSNLYLGVLIVVVIVTIVTFILQKEKTKKNIGGVIIENIH